ncbi:hypothetical protein [Bradyrhizobium sp. UFLA05-112]
MKLTAERPFANPETAARKLVELAAGIEPVQDGRIHIEKINAPLLDTLKASGEEFGAGINLAIDRGWLEMHESGTYVRLLASGNTLEPLARSRCDARGASTIAWGYGYPLVAAKYRPSSRRFRQRACYLAVNAARCATALSGSAHPVHDQAVGAAERGRSCRAVRRSRPDAC